MGWSTPAETHTHVIILVLFFLQGTQTIIEKFLTKA